jgi:hypothetical protein
MDCVAGDFFLGPRVCPGALQRFACFVARSSNAFHADAFSAGSGTLGAAIGPPHSARSSLFSSEPQGAPGGTFPPPPAAAAPSSLFSSSVQQQLPGGGSSIFGGSAGYAQGALGAYGPQAVGAFGALGAASPPPAVAVSSSFFGGGPLSQVGRQPMEDTFRVLCSKP